MHYIASIICTPTENFTIHPQWAGNKRHSHENHKLSLCQTPSTTLGRENCLTRSSLISEMNFLQFANRDLTTASFTKCPKLVLLLLLMMLRESLSSGALCAVRFSFTPHRTVLCACVSSSTTNIKSTTTWAAVESTKSKAGWWCLYPVLAPTTTTNTSARAAHHYFCVVPLALPLLPLQNIPNSELIV